MAEDNPATRSRDMNWETMTKQIPTVVRENTKVSTIDLVGLTVLCRGMVTVTVHAALAASL